MQPLHVAITSGPTREPIDDVRFVSNVSTGRLGVALAEAFCAAGHRVTFVHGAGSASPRAHASLEVVEFTTASSLLEALTRSFADSPAPDVLVHAAAVADYAPVKVDGKIKSTAAELVVHMRPTPKVADAFRRAFPTPPIVLFKLESGIARTQLHERARAAMQRVGAQVVVANLLEEVGAAAHRADVLRADGSVEAVDGRERLAAAVVRECERLVAASRGSPASTGVAR